MTKFAKPIMIVLAVIGFGYLGWKFFYAQSIPGFWEINQEESVFYFSSTKNGDIAEQHTLSRFKGHANYTGKYVIQLDLASLETGADIRNERMREFLFEVDQYPVARIDGKFDLSSVAEIEIGETKEVPFTFSLSLHGVKQDMSAEIRIKRISWGGVIITPVQPILVDAKDFNLEAGLETLRELAGLDSISHEVPIDFRFQFDESMDSFEMPEE